jgi:predicted ATP-dependent protease
MTKGIEIVPLASHQLSVPASEALTEIESTNELQPFDGILGQDRAVSAIQFGVAMKSSGYHLFLMGEHGTGRSSYIKDYLNIVARKDKRAFDCVYVNNFENPREPLALTLPAGEGKAFRESIKQLIDGLLATFPAVFEHPTYQRKKTAIEREFNRRYDKAVEEVERSGLKRNIALFKDATTISFAPMKEGKTLEDPEFAQLEDHERSTYHEAISDLEAQLNDALVELPQWRRESVEKQRTLTRDTINQAITPLMTPLFEHYRQDQEVTSFLYSLQKDLHKVVVSDLMEERLLDMREETLKRSFMEDNYLPNLVVSHESTEGAPVIYEPHPSYSNLFGRIEFSNEQGALVTNYQKICPGALHRANGGYLVLDAEKLLSEHWVWEALKRSLQQHELKMESPYSDMGLINTTTLIPQTLPLDVKLILIGSRSTYYLLQDLDDDFRLMFKVLVDFDGEIKRSPEQILNFCRLLKSRCQEKGYADIAAKGLQRMIEFSSRLSEDQRKLSARIGDVFELLAEAEFIRSQRQDLLINAEHIDRALSSKEQRSGRIQENILTDILDGTILIDTDREAIGKINGLTVLEIGDSSFGIPARISATVYPGSRGIVDIERESNLGQNIHTKGVMILTGYLGYKYAQRFPLEVSAHIAMEQSYGYVDGDSASLGEACCLISALSGIPLRQSMAITGSINQYGEVQAIGGANEKIEGFFAVCEARGLTGQQGVIIPNANVHTLVLKRQVISAVEAGLFHIYAVKDVDESLEILTGSKAGKLNRNGNYPRGSVNAKVLYRLKEIYEMEKEDDEAESTETDKVKPNTRKETPIEPRL